MSFRSTRAITNAKAICEQHLRGRYDLEVIDIYQEPLRYSGDELVAVPTLIKLQPLPVRRIVGDLTDVTRALRALGLNSHE